MSVVVKTIHPRWVRGLGAATLLTACAALSACSGDSRSNSCDSNRDCDNGLICVNDRCIDPADGPDAGFGDADGPDGPRIVAEDYLVSYYLSASIPAVRNEVRLYSTVDGDLGKMHSDALNCGAPNDCQVSANLEHFVHMRPSAQTQGMTDIYVHPIGEDYAVADEGTLLVEGVRDIRLFGDNIAYTRTQAGVVNAYHRPIAGGAELLLSEVGTEASTTGAFHVDPANNMAVVYRYDLQNLRVQVGPIGQPVTERIYEINTANFQQSGGSHFGGHIQTALSADGRFLAFLLEAPNDYGTCSSPDTFNTPECPGPGQKCGNAGLCTAREVTLNFIDLEARENLGEDCASADACGEVHECFRPSGSSFEGARCQPRRVVVGLPAAELQGGKTGCELTQGKRDYQYTAIRGPLNFGPDGRLYTVASRQCRRIQGQPDTESEFNIEKTNIVRIDPTTGEVEEVWGNPGEDYSEAKCYDAENRRIDVTNCIVHIRNTLLSPGGNQLVFVATNPQILDAGLAGQGIDLWTVRRDGVGHDWVGRNSELAAVRTFQVHPMAEAAAEEPAE